MSKKREEARLVGMTYELQEAWVRATPEQREAVAQAMRRAGISVEEAAANIAAVSDALGRLR